MPLSPCVSQVREGFLLFFRYFAMIEDTPLVDDRIGTTQMGDYKLFGIGDIPQA